VLILLGMRNDKAVRAGTAAKILFVVPLLLPGLLPLALWGQGPASQNSPAPAFQTRFPRYVVRAGDVLDLNFPFTPEFNQTITVQPDGYVTVRGLGDVRIQDKTVPEIAEMMRTAYSRILRDPEVTVELKDFEKPYFVVGGEVGRPGKYDLRGDTTVLQAVAVAGDFKAESRNSQVLLFRRISDEWAEVRRIDIKQMLRTKNLAEDLHLKPGDMVYVPKNPWSRIDRFIPVPTLGMFFNPVVH
jgi:polysaccharide export outer membrane protein